MKFFKRFLLFVFCFLPAVAGADVATTAGSNLTAWNGNAGATNNNNWNQMMNSRTQATGAVGAGATADFGNCNSLILRCAQPKCSGCNTMEIARSIVAGCVNSNDVCKKYGDDLVEFISAQMVSNATSKAQQAEIAAQQQAASVAAAQNSAQLQQMQAQMQQMQYDIQQQNAQQLAQMQVALDEQKAMTAAAMEKQAESQSVSNSAVASNNTTLTDEQVAAAQQGVAADILARQQISGQIMSKIESAEVALKSLKATMNNAFEYAGCDMSGNNCVGPKRVQVFKTKALQFFEPYNDVLDELYDALIIAQAVGVDITDIYMMLNGSCNVWGEYLCSDTAREVYNSDNCQNGRSVKSGNTNGGAECYDGQVIPAEDSPACVLQRTLKDQEEVQRNWLYAETGDRDDMIRVGCASAALDSSVFFRNRKKQATIDIEILERIIEQDAPAIFGGNRLAAATKPDPDGVKYCAVTSTGYQELQKAAATKTLPKKVCVADSKLAGLWTSGGAVSADVSDAVQVLAAHAKCQSKKGPDWVRCLCESSSDNEAYWDRQSNKCLCVSKDKSFDTDSARCMKSGETVDNNTKSYSLYMSCVTTGGTPNFGVNYGDVCVCDKTSYNPVTKKCVDGFMGNKIVIDK